MAEIAGEEGSGQTPLCPDCGGPMELRTARRGRNAGGLFWGCGDYPRCRGTLDYEGSAAAVTNVEQEIEEPDPAEAPDCPECGAPMQIKVARRGRNRGGRFWSCTRYPDCRVILDFAAAASGPPSDHGATPSMAAIPRRILWADGTLDRPGWTCRYTSIGGSLRAFPESAQVARGIAQAWIARTESFADVDSDVERVAGLLKKIIQRGAAPPLDPAAERALLDSIGLAEALEPSLMPGDVSVRLRRRLNIADLEAAVCWEADDFSFDQLELGSDEERAFVENWVAQAIGPTAARWAVPQPSLDGLVTAAGLPAAGERRADFLVTTPHETPFLIEIDGAQHNGSVVVDDDRDLLLEEAGYAVVRVTTGELRSGTGLGLDEVKSHWRRNGHAEANAHHHLVWAPVQLHRTVLALIDALSVGFLRGERWTIAIEDPLDVTCGLLHPYFDLMAAVDLLWGGTVAPKEVIFGRGDHWLHAELGEHGYSTPTSVEAPGAVDVVIRLESNRSAVDGLQRTSESPEIVVRSAFLPVQVLDPVYEGAGRIAVRSEGERIEWAVRKMLRSIFAKEDFREGQLDALFEVIEGRDCAVLLPTGAGKSLIYQLAGLVLPGRTLVVDPLVALMEDQIDGLRAHGIDRVAAISSFTTMQGMGEALLEQVASGEALFVFVAPERLQQQKFRQALRAVSQTSPINLAVVDEAHCVSEWGHDFRTSYLNLGQTLREVCKDLYGAPPPILALTGTASRAVLRDVLIELGIERDSERSVVRPKTFDRPELRYTIIRSEPSTASAELQGFVRNLPARFGVPASDFFRPRAERTFSGLVFVPHTNGSHGVVDVRSELAGLGPTQPAMYSGGPPRGFEDNWEKVKRAHAAAFKANEAPLLVSTKAFGMGIDKGNIRYVVHYGIPGSIEGYYQEVGRAGRDRARAECALILIEYDEDRARRLLSEDIDFETARGEHKGVTWGDADDITRQLWFFFNSFRGLDTELGALQTLLDDISDAGELGKRQTLEVPMGDTDEQRQERERALHRLVVLGVVRDYLVEWGARKFLLELAPADAGRVADRLVAYVRRNQPGRVEAISTEVAPARELALEQATIVAARVLIKFVYDTVARSRLRSLREMWLAAREAQNDPNGAFRQRILDYLSQGAIAPTLERLVDRPRFVYGDWIEELAQVVDVDDACEMRGDSARLLASYPDHPGLLFARAFSEVIDDRGDFREFASNLDSSIRSARDRYGLSEPLIDEFGIWLLNDAKDRRPGALVLALAALERHGVATTSVRAVHARALTGPGADPALRVLALAATLDQSHDALAKVLERYEGATR
jgi:ATP-dependent DNA helicase RecQ